MKRVRSLLAATAAIAAFGGPAIAADTPQWVRYAAISPDGDAISFTYRGQIYVVDAQGGLAVPVTSQGYYSYGAVWSPNSEELAFASDINGDDDVYVTNFDTARLTRLTWSSRPEVPTSFTPDGKGVLYNMLRLGDPKASLQGPQSTKPQLYQVTVDTDDQQLVLPNYAQQAVWNRSHSQLLYTYNPSNDPDTRQHRVESNARQIWLFDARSGKYSRLVEGTADMLNPVWGPEDKSVYYVSEASGSLNVWKRDLASGEDTQLTNFTEFPVRYLSVSDKGDVAFTYNGQLHRLSAGETEPKKLEIGVPEQLMDQAERFETTATSEFSASPTGSHWAAVVNSDVFLIDRSGEYRQITNTPEQEKDVTFSPDGRWLAYASQRDHDWGLYFVEVAQDGQGGLPFVHNEEAMLIEEGHNYFQPSFSPDGSRVAFIADRREVKVLDLETQEVATLFAPEDYNTSYGDGDLWFSWSPTSQDLLVQWRQVPFSPLFKAGIVPADGSGPIQPITSAITDVTMGLWSRDATQIIGLTSMFSLRTIDQGAVLRDFYRVFLSDDARGDFIDACEGITPTPGTAQAEGYDADADVPAGAKRYPFQEARPSYLEGRLSSYSERFLFAAALGDNRHLLTLAVDPDGSLSVDAMDLKSGEVQVITDLNSIEDIQSVALLPELDVLDIKAASGVYTIPLADPSQVQFTPLSISYSAQRSARRAATFEQVWADIKYKFYRPDIEGRDWEKIGSNYRAFLSDIATDRELSELIDEMLGELSASHLFVSFSQPPLRQALATRTGALGLFPDYAHTGGGVRIAAVQPGGPLSRPSFDLEAGDSIVAVNGVGVAGINDLDRLLNGMVNKPIALTVSRVGEEGEDTLTVRPFDVRQEIMLNHSNWVDSRRELTSQLSNGCLAYQYLPEMNNDAYVSAYGRLLSENSSSKAALVDVRSNRGGNLHRQMLTFLSGEAYGQVGFEGRPWEVEPLDRWNKPSTVLIDTFSYSDGSVFPQAYQDMKMGSLVGDKLLGTGTGVNYIESPLMPGLEYGVPVQPFRKMDGSYYENREITPEVWVPFDPNMAAQGRDYQLEMAVETLMKQLGPDACLAPAAQ
ncbi:S41 family peptidase [Paradevosia shaoguanensis]|uniref:S41 family peptidase n=1 Tax=Paradevosia shaoguanensis TaxID=1335043 RepID=UPI003C75B27E